MKAKFRLYTEDLNRDLVEKLIAKSFKGFTVIEAMGYWNGIRENTLIIEIIATKQDLHLIEHICEKIKQLNKQEAVLFTVDYIDSVMI